MHEIILIRDGSTSRMLADAARKIFLALKLDTTEERESSNYVDGFYFVGYAGNVAVKVCYSDGAEMPDYPYWVVLQNPAPGKNVAARINSHPEAVATELTRVGFDVFIPSRGFGRTDWDHAGAHYRANEKNA